MPRRAFDRNEARQLCALIAARCESRHCREHLAACKRALELGRINRHLASAFAIAAKEGAVTADDWRRWKLQLRHQRRKLLSQRNVVRASQRDRLLESELGALVTESFRIPPQLLAAKRP